MRPIGAPTADGGKKVAGDTVEPILCCDVVTGRLKRTTPPHEARRIAKLPASRDSRPPATGMSCRVPTASGVPSVSLEGSRRVVPAETGRGGSAATSSQRGDERPPYQRDRKDPVKMVACAHLALGKDAPLCGAVQRSGVILSGPHHHSSSYAGNWVMTE